MIAKASRKRTEAITGGTSSEISPATEVIANNLDLLTEILVRLPAKSLIRFKSVSKHWLSLLSDSRFGSNHSTRNPSPSISGLYFYCKGRVKSVPLHGHRNLPSLAFVDGLGGEFSYSTMMILHSWNGLLLCRSHHFITTSFIVCNPTTQKSEVLSSPSWYSRCDHFAYLAFDPSISPHYKVVLIEHSISPPNQIEVYSSHSACWNYLFVEEKCGREKGVFWNGAIHWLTDDNVLLRFNVDAEEMIATPNPPKPKILTLEKTLYFGECGGCLVLIQSPSCYPTGFRILEQDKDYSGWSVKYRVNLWPMISEFLEMEKMSHMFYGLQVLCALKGEKEKDFAVVLAIPWTVFLYNLKRKTWDVLPDLLPSELIDNCAYPFVETLFPI